MFHTTKTELYKCIALLLSTLLFSLQYIFIVLWLPAIYVNFIVPYFIWKLLFHGNIKNIKPTSLIWKIPAITLLAFCSMFWEISAFLMSSFADGHFLITAAFFFAEILIIRIITYTLTIFIWQPELFKFPKTLLIIAFLYCMTAGYEIYLSHNTPEKYTSLPPEITISNNF